MQFELLHLTHFRNYAALSASFCPGINVVTGNNGEGKTNILEALHYLAMTRGWNSKTEKYALKEEEQYFIVEGMLREGEKLHNIQCNYLPPKGKKILVDKKPQNKMSDHIGRIPLVAVLPNDTQLIDGSPSQRRRFMDSLISQYSPDYLHSLIQYEHALNQRNALLALMAERQRWDPEQLTMWSNQLIAPGMVIAKERKRFLEIYIPIFSEYFHLIVSEKESPSISLDSQFDTSDAAAWQQAFKLNLERDRFAQRTGAGVHKDELVFEIGGQAVRNYGSQGQQKTFVIALKLAQYLLLSRERQKPAILLLDDIFDKLDMHRLKAIAGLLDNVVEGQVFITDTSLDRCRQVFQGVKNREVRYFEVANAQVRQLEEKQDA